jgi:hypothetical protein
MARGAVALPSRHLAPGCQPGRICLPHARKPLPTPSHCVCRASCASRSWDWRGPCGPRLKDGGGCLRRLGSCLSLPVPNCRMTMMSPRCCPHACLPTSPPRLRAQLAVCTCAVSMAGALATFLRSFEWPGCLHASATLRSFLGVPARASPPPPAPLLKPLPVRTEATAACKHSSTQIHQATERGQEAGLS